MPGRDTEKLPSYERSPLVEIACSVVFSPLESLLSPHIGLLWARFQPDYPICEDVAPIASRLERASERDIDSEIELTDIPPLPRVWFISEDGTKIIQFQRERFSHNVRKLSADRERPKYERIIQSFQDYLKTFNDFLEEAELERIEPLQYELTYVNQISPEQSDPTFEDIGKIFPDLNWRISSERLFTEPQSLSWTTAFELPERLGRLRTLVRKTGLDEPPTIFFELTVRGIGTNPSLEGLQSWFDRAHEWIVRAFVDLTSEEIQIENWQRRL